LFFNSNILMLPGLGGSGPDHWQTLWEKANPGFRRVHARDWEHPEREEWVGNLEAAVKAAGPQTILVAHSLACLQVAHWASQTLLTIEGALLVAPPNPERAGFPGAALSFRGVPRNKLPFLSCLVASTDDPHGDIDYAERTARNWGSRFVNVGALGHINAASNIGYWPEGFKILQSLKPQMK
jgi:predicted alpha/beta hydrolase family esterase